MKKNALQKPIILIGGTAGVGKTTLAREICAMLSIDHSLGTGFIREIVRSQTTPETDPDLFTYTFRSMDPVQTLRMQAIRLNKAIVGCINRAFAEGTSLVVEGNHLLPEFYADTGTVFILLRAPKTDEHFRRLHGTSHLNRKVSLEDLTNTRLIDEFLVGQAGMYHVPIFEYGENIDFILSYINNKSR